jgi:DNA-binding Xre family transcriptional regulator
MQVCLLIHRAALAQIFGNQNLKGMLRKKKGKTTLKADSIVVQLAPILAARNIKHPYKFLRKIGITNHGANNLLTGKTVQLNLQYLTALCQALECTPNDLFALPKQHLAQHHPLQALADTADAFSQQDIDKWLKGKSLEEVKRIVRE